jgi:hypothetical protein
MFMEMGREALRALKARQVLRVDEAMEVVKGVGEMGKMAEDSLRCPITTLQGFLQHGTPLHQIRLGIILSRKLLIAVQPRMCRSLLC